MRKAERLATQYDMTGEKNLCFYLPKEMIPGAKAGEQNIINAIRHAIEPVGFTVDFCKDTPSEIAQARHRPGYAMYHLHEPAHDRAMCFRKVYYYPFWAVEVTQARWNWRVAKAQFNPCAVDPEAAKRFSDRWRRNQFKGTVSGPGGYIYVPMQGKLTAHRSFQTMAPIDMLSQVLERSDGKPVIASLHPNELYSLKEQAALESLLALHANLSVRMGGMSGLLPEADFIVTQNSSVAFAGILLHKPSILFGQIDFHHVTLNVGDIGIDQAFDRVRDHRPAYDKFLFWFLRDRAINARRDDAPKRIRQALKNNGWPV